MGFIKTLIERSKKKKKALNDMCNTYIMRIDAALQELNDLFADEQAFIDIETANLLQEKILALLSEMHQGRIKKIRRTINYKNLILKQSELRRNIDLIKQKVALHNERAANEKIKYAYELIGEVEGRTLDRQQISCIIKEAHNHLVTAGAGTGKTTTVVGRIKFLLKSGKCSPQDILVLSFTHASAKEMCDRIQKETNESVAASTFHKLGMSIIKKVNGITPKISELNLQRFIKEQLKLNMQNSSYLNMLSRYLLYNRIVSRSEFEFETQSEYDEYLRLNPPITVNKEKVKSYGEMDIANFLKQNGVSYVYERSYSVDTRTSEYGQYYPDFYLPDYDIYIEYFGINREGQVPPYFMGKNGMSASQTYKASMEWKRETHRANGTTMIECYAYEKLDGSLLDSLKEKLEKHSVTFSPQSPEELWTKIAEEDSSALDGIAELFETLISLIKSNNYTIDDVHRLNTGNSNVHANKIILQLLEPIFNEYCQYLSNNNAIDFNDMINTAAQYIRDGRFVNPYKYVIVDEYQDISRARFSLLDAMRKSNDFDLFCVGDDWQSIYRFAGSDIGYILNFERYWGRTEVSRIETTYRFTQKLIEISGRFIMKNPAQIKKSLKGRADSVSFPLGEISGYTEKYAVKFMIKRLEDLPKGSSVFFIGRYTFDSKLLDENTELNCSYNNTTGIIDVRYDKRADLKMSFITAHKSKGLQADYVFIINNKKSRMGFPSKIQDAAILNLLLDNSETYPYAEERRLFYVALTRAKKKAFIVTVKGQESDFVTELKTRYKEQLENEQFECPLCGGRLVRKKGPYSEFFGCTNYRTTGCKYKRKISKKSEL